MKSSNISSIVLVVIHDTFDNKADLVSDGKNTTEAKIEILKIVMKSNPTVTRVAIFLL
jgi:hypothetical protein